MLRRRMDAVPRTARKIIAAVAALLAVVGLVVIAHTTGKARSGVPGSLTVATWNMCGVRQWHCTDFGAPSAKKAQLERLATRSGVRAFFLQETCAGDLEAVRADLVGSWHTLFRPYTSRDATGHTSTIRCAGFGQGAAGIALLSAYPLSGTASVPAQQPTVGLRRGILCATVAAYRVRLCTTHLSRPGDDRAHPHWEFRDDQLRALVAAAPSPRTVYGGDLNLDPPGPRNPASWVWPDAPYRADRECDQKTASSRAGRPTHVSGHKIDYLFTGLPRTGCSVHETGASDHYALLMRVRTG
ncbi:endonuclease/exonuclease/phosphatase family protein [Streptomyces sp. NPDC047017]|uniref:endonuclease/exonuclease/phosphatase family protein n=1 Tax=Streptomyces sp. NPDC047017 TaxID=3155024 RepID=UPI0033E41C93